MEIKAKKHDKKGSEIYMVSGRTQFGQNRHEGFHVNGESSSNGSKKKGNGRSKSKSKMRLKNVIAVGTRGIL